MKIRDRIKELRRVKASELRPNPKNWRTHPQKQLDAIRGVLAEVGFAGAELARELPDGTLQLIDGHARAEIAGEAEVPVLVLDVDEAEADKILATFDPIGAMATADAVKLDAILREVETGNEALADMLTALAEDNGILDGLNEAIGEVVEDEVPEPPADPITKPGDLWILGRHRVLCGDSTKADDVGRLMDGAKADCVLTDPPYGIGKLMTGGTWATKQDAQFAMMREWDDATQQLFFDIASSLGPCVIWGGNYFSTPPSRCWLAWNKPEFPTMSSVELAWTNLDHNAKRIECPRAHQCDGKKEHATQKPIKVMAWSLEFLPDGLVYDPFLGSGTTLIAAEQLGRKCYGMEISPAYCDVIVKRWETLTGKKAVLEDANP
jgi:DNA modification methylase